MKIYVVFTHSRGSHYEDDCIEKIFSSREAAERHVLEDVMSDSFDKVEVADYPGVTWHYFMERPAYRIEEHYMED